MTDQANPRPQELEDRLDALMANGPRQPAPADGGSVATKRNETDAEDLPGEQSGA